MSDQAPSSSSRRKFLKVIGGGVIFAAAGAGTFLGTRTPAKAIEPWKMALGPKAGVDPRHILLSHAILAPNPHNRQPWIADLSVENEITLFCDLGRRLPETDPFDRQITIGLGCFLELLDLTAKEHGYLADISVFPDGEPAPRLDERPVARIKITKSDAAQKDPLFAQLFDRRSNKDPFDMSQNISAIDADNILSAAKHSTDVSSVIENEDIAQLRDITWAALDTEMRTFRTAKESIDLMRIGKAEIEANPDGIDMGGAFFETLSLLGLLSRDIMLKMDETTMQQMADAMRPPLATAMGYVQVRTNGNSRSDQINAGRDYVRLNLKATELGIAMHPLSQALQEFEEMKPHRATLEAKLSVKSDERLQMFARIGYGENPIPSPRWPYEAKIKGA